MIPGKKPWPRFAGPGSRRFIGALQQRYRKDRLASENTGPTSPLAEGLVRWWDMEELTGDRIDSVGGFALTETAGALSTTPGPSGVGLAVACDATGALQEDGATAFSLADSAERMMTIGVWCRFDKVAYSEYESVIGKNLEYALQRRRRVGFDHFFHYRWNDAGTLSTSTDTTRVNKVGIWELVFYRISLGFNEAEGSEVRSPGFAWDDEEGYVAGSFILPSTAPANANPMIVSGATSNGGTTQNVGGGIGPIAIWDRDLSWDERILFYNSGIALRYIDLY